MASAGIVPYFASFVIVLIVVVVLIPTSSGQLTSDFYDNVCPLALPTIRAIVERAIMHEARMGASLLRLHFHDCFVQGCDASVLLDKTVNFTSEKDVDPNKNSLRGFDVVDEIKAAVDSACNDSVVSCADILAVAARDSVNILGGPCYKVLLGRRDSLRSYSNDVLSKIPSPQFNFATLLSNFQSQKLDLIDLVVLSGAHTIGLARCHGFWSRAYNDSDIDPKYATALKSVCPLIGGDNNTVPLDATTTVFDTVYYEGLMTQQGLLHSDQELFSGGNTESVSLVTFFNKNHTAFFEAFGQSMIKMGNLNLLIGNNGQVRTNCRKVN